MERQLNHKQCLLVRVWMFGPIFVALVALIFGCIAVVQPRPLAMVGVALFLAMGAATTWYAIRESRYIYFPPRRSSYLDLALCFAVFVAITYVVNVFNVSYKRYDLMGSLTTGVVCLVVLAPHILFRGVRRQTENYPS